MGYMTLFFNCINCGQSASANPDKVPTVRITRDTDGIPRPDRNGTKEPLCEACAERLNQNRIDAGLPAFPIHPQAYQPAPEQEI